jgi:DnaJ-class molecular chaperone
VASESTDSEDRTEEAHQPRECMPCRGSGKVISNLGGTPSTVTCPWCEGGGVRLPGVDAQSKWQEGDKGEEAAVDEGEEAAVE